MSRISHFAISSAVKSDLNKMVDLLQQLFSIEADFIADPVTQMQGLTLLLESESAEIFVVRSDNDEVIAMATLQLVISTAEGGSVAWLEDVVVDSDYRGQGIGQKLLTYIFGWVENRGIKRVQLVADRDNRSALDFYNKLGWQKTHLTVLRRR
jgi:GNAT superfamily N-acetyltransferase